MKAHRGMLDYSSTHTRRRDTRMRSRFEMGNWRFSVWNMRLIIHLQDMFKGLRHRIQTRCSERSTARCEESCCNSAHTKGAHWQSTAPRSNTNGFCETTLEDESSRRSSRKAYCGVTRNCITFSRIDATQTSRLPGINFVSTSRPANWRRSSRACREKTPNELGVAQNGTPRGQTESAD